MPTLLITGANRGLGLEFARSYAAAGWTVSAVVRDPAKATALKALKGVVEVHKGDVTDSKSIAAMAKALGGAPIDLLINNAGAYLDRNSTLGGLDFSAWEETFRVNTLAPLRVAEAWAENVAQSSNKLTEFITRRMGSFAD